MNKIEILCKSYLAACQADTPKPYQCQFDAMYGFLRFRLKQEDFMEAESLLNDLVAVVEESAFSSGVGYLPQLLAELIEE